MTTQTNHHQKNGTDLLVSGIRKRLDKGERIGSNEVRMLCAMIEGCKARIAELEGYIDSHNAQVLAELEVQS